MKQCIKCGRPLRGKATKYCSKTCCKRYLKNRWQKRRKDVVNAAARARRARTNRAGERSWNRSNPEKLSAHRQVSKALSEGRLVREPCVRCGGSKTHAHHPDYSKPLDVIWLCASCHRKNYQMKEKAKIAYSLKN